MKLTKCLFALAVLLISFSVPAMSHGQTKEDAAHGELRALMKKVLAAYNAGDMDELITYLDDNVVVTWQNAKVTKNAKEVKTFFEEMTKGPRRVVEKSTIAPVADELSLLYNEDKTAIAFGHSKDHYKLMDGLVFDQDTRWSATVVKKNGVWKVVSVHISVNVFDNPILDIAIKKTAMWVGGISGGASLLVGLLAGAIFFRHRAKPAVGTGL